jgi:hypothetical protein
MNISDDADLTVLLDWWDKLEKWLNRSDRSHLSASSSHLIDQMKLASEKGQLKKTWNLMERVKYLINESDDDQEIAEVRFKCARIAVDMGALKEAESLLRETARKYKGSNWHNYSIAAWLLGCIEWILPGKQDEAILSWQHSLAGFEDLIRRYEANKGESEWYSNLCSELKDALQKSIEDEKIAPPVADPQRSKKQAADSGPKAGPPESEPGPTESPQPPKPLKNSDLLYLFPVVEEIPASGFGPAGYDPYQIASVETDQFIIDKKPHQMIRLKNRGRVVNMAGREHVVVRIVGDSMNNAGIDPGDYVLLRLQIKPDDQDIVAAAIIQEDTLATLKRYIERGDSITLKPESKNPAHVETTFTKKDQGLENKFVIVGVAIAVFKPI